MGVTGKLFGAAKVDEGFFKRMKIMNIKDITMKRLTQIFQALLGVVALILTALIAAGRLAWRKIRT